MGDELFKFSKLVKPQGLIGIVAAILAFIGSIILWARPDDNPFDIFSDSQITMIFAITIVALIALITRRPLLFSFIFGVTVAAEYLWIWLADVFRRQPKDSFDYQNKYVAGFGLGAIAMLLEFVVVRAKFRKMKPWKFFSAIIGLIGLIGCGLLWQGYDASATNFLGLVFTDIEILRWSIVFLFINLFFLASLFVKWKPSRPIALFLTGFAVTLFQHLQDRTEENELSKNSKAGLYLTSIAGALIFLLIVVIKTDKGRFHPGKILKKVKDIRFLFVLIAFVNVLVGDALYWSYLEDIGGNTLQQKYVLAMFLLVVVANVVGHLLKQPLIFIASLGVIAPPVSSLATDFENLSLLLKATKDAYADQLEPSDKARAGLVLIWIGLGFAFLATPLKRRKHLEFNSPRVLLGTILTIGLTVMGIVIATSDDLPLSPQAFQVQSIYTFFIAIVFTVAWTTKPDHTQVIASFLCGQVIFKYLGSYHNIKGDLYDDQPKAGFILAIILMGLATIFLNIPIFTRYKKKDKKKGEKKRDREDAPLMHN